jgi:hypothetical protein
MTVRSRAWIALTVLLAACGTARDTSETAALAPSLGLTEMVLLWRTDGFDRGDTVYVNLSEISEAGTVPYYENGDPAGTLRLATLGRTDPGIMIVNANRLMVRRCRSTGCSEVGYVVHGQAVQVQEPAGGWYRIMTGGEPLGYLFGQYLRHPLEYQRSQLAVFSERAGEYFGRELAGLPARERADVADALSSATSPLQWEMLRHSRGLSAARARAVMRRTLTALLRDAGGGS